MPIQAFNSQTSFSYNPISKETSAKAHSTYYRDLLKPRDLCPKRQIDHFLKFSKTSSSQNLSSVALDILGGKRVRETENDSQLDSSKEVDPVRQILDVDGRVIQLIALDGSLDYKIAYVGNITTITNQITGEIHQQEIDNQGRLIREVLPCGLKIKLNFDGEYLSEVILPDQSRVSYQYTDQTKVAIQRLGVDKQVQYEHVYNVMDGLLNETLIGEVTSLQGSFEKAASNAEHPTGDLLSNEARLLDDQRRVISYNGYSCSYDEEGRLTKKDSSDQTVNCSYDALDRLSSVEVDGKKIEYTYDLDGRRLSKTVTVDGKTSKEFYLYQGVNQIGVYNEAKEPILS